MPLIGPVKSALFTLLPLSENTIRQDNVPCLYDVPGLGRYSRLNVFASPSVSSLVKLWW